MADLNPRCRICNQNKVWIGISGSAIAVCPADCSHCVACRHPDAVLRITSAEILERTVIDWLLGPMNVRYQKIVQACTKCGSQTTTETPV